MSARQPTVSRYDAFSRTIGRLVAALFAFAFLATTPLGISGVSATQPAVCQSVAHAGVCIESDASAAVLPSETRDEFDRTQHRPVGSFDDPHFLPQITSVSVSFFKTALDIGSLRLPALPPPGRGPPLLA